MSAARPVARSLLSRRLAAAPVASSPSTRPSQAPPACRHFHSSSSLAARRRPRFRSLHAEELGLVSPDAVEKFTKERYPELTAEDKKELAKRYTPEQLAAVEAGEAAVDAKDLTIQGRLRNDPYQLPYLDDFSTIRPTIDRRPRKNTPPDTRATWMDDSEFPDDFDKWSEKFLPSVEEMEAAGAVVPPELLQKLERQEQLTPEEQSRFDAANAKYAQMLQDPKYGPGDVDALEYMLDRSALTDNNAQSDSYLAPALASKIPGVTGLYRGAVDPEDEGLDETGIYQDLKKKTGMSVRQILNISVKVLVYRSVSNQTRLGKVRSSSILAIAGNKNGWLGLGIAKSTEQSSATMKAKLAAIKNLKPIRRYENRTIYGNVEAKVGGTVVQLAARPPGFGLRVSHRIFEMCRAAGIQDLAAKFPRSRNPLNTVKATYQALLNQPDPEQIAIGRGKKMVDVRKVYYGGNVY